MKPAKQNWPLLLWAFVSILLWFKTVIALRIGDYLNISYTPTFTVGEYDHSHLVPFLIAMLCIAVLGQFRRDYSPFIQQSLKMRIYFDRSGLLSKVRKLNHKSIGEFEFVIGWEEARLQYLDRLNALVAEIDATSPFRFTKDSVGEGTFNFEVVRRASGWSHWQRYGVRDASGHLEFRQVGWGGVVTSYFDSGATKEPLFEVSVKEFLSLNASIEVVFDQYIMLQSMYRRDIDPVVTLSHVKYLPEISVEFTVYCVRAEILGLEDDGEKVKLIPVAYATYR